jgi:hypothetical protein
VLKQAKLVSAARAATEHGWYGQDTGPDYHAGDRRHQALDKVGKYASYSRSVASKRVSKRQEEGQNNAKCGNPYFAWAFAEATSFAIRYSPRSRRFFERKRAKTNTSLALQSTRAQVGAGGLESLHTGIESHLD